MNRRWPLLTAGLLGLAIGLGGLLWTAFPTARPEKDPETGAVFYSGKEVDGAVVLAPKGRMENSPVLKAFLAEGRPVLLADPEQKGMSPGKALELLEERAGEQKAPVLAGYDTGAFDLLEFLREEKPPVQGVVLLAPLLKTQALKAPMVSGGRYQFQDEWLNGLSWEKWDYPTLLLAASGDQQFTTTEATLLYNALSGDDIFRLGGSYTAEKNGVRLTVVHGLFHQLLPSNKDVVSQVQGFLADQSGQKEEILGISWKLTGWFRLLTMAGLGACLLLVGGWAENKNVGVIAWEEKRLRLLGKKAALGVASLPLACLALLLPVPAGSGLFAGIFGIAGCLEAGISLWGRKESRGKVDIVAVQEKQHLYGWLLAVGTTAVWAVLLFTGLPHQPFSVGMALCWLALTILFLPGFVLRLKQAGHLAGRLLPIYYGVCWLPFLAAAAGIFLLKGQGSLLVFFLLLPCMVLVELLGKALLNLFADRLPAAGICAALLAALTVSLGRIS